MTDSTITLRVKADTGNTGSQIDGIKGKVDALGNSGAAAGTKVSDGMRKASAAVSNAGAQVKQAASESTTQLKAMAAASDAVAEAGNRLGLKIGAAFGMALSTISALVVRSINLSDQTGKLAERLGTTTEFISTMGFAAKQNGSNIDTMNTALRSLADNATKAAGGARIQARVFNAMGISAKDAAGNVKSVDVLLPELAKKFASYADGSQKAALYTLAFNDNSLSLLPTLNKLGGKDGFKGATESAEKYSQVISGDMAKSSTEIKDNIAALTAQMTGFGNDLNQQVLPVVLNIGKAFLDSGGDAEKSKDKFSGVNTVLEGVATFAALVVGGVQKVGVVLGATADGISGTVEVSKMALERFSTFVSTLTTSGLGAARAAIANFDKENAARLKSVGVQLMAGGAALSASLAQIDSDTADKLELIHKGLDKTGTAAKAAGAAAGTAAAPIVDLTRKFAVAQNEGERLAASLEKQAATFGQSAQASDFYDIAITKMTASERARAITAANLLVVERDLADAAKGTADAYARLTAIGKTLSTQDTAIVLGMKGMDAAHIAFAHTMQEISKEWEDAKAAGGELSAVYIKVGEDVAAAKKLLDDTDFGNAIKDIDALIHSTQEDEKTPFDKTLERIKEVSAALKVAKDNVEIFGEARVDDLQEQLDKLHLALARGMIDSTAQALKGIQSLTKEGSKEYEAMRIAIDALAIAQAVLAVIHQGTAGDPYSAFARMAAMAAAVAPLLADIGAAISSMSGDGGVAANGSAARQAAQGTGSVLGDSKAQSESIMKSLEITADATSKLVGINRGMLSALQAVEAGISGASTQIARGSSNAAFPAIKSGGLVLGLFGSSKKIIDEGIVIAGGTLQSMLDNIVAGAYQTIHKNGGLFGSSKNYDNTVDISKEFSDQFELIIHSIADTVRAGAIALGLLPSQVEAAIGAYKVAETKISLMGLSSEDQQKALEAVFSQIFDGLAGSVVPFIAQFQKAGEGLGETLVRVATEVQVMQQAMSQLGLVVVTTDPEKFAQIADGLIQMAGGVSAFIEQITNFEAAFASDDVKFDSAKNALDSAFDQIGLKLPATRDGMWELMQSLDASTESGQRQIATILGLTDVADQYYNLLDKRQRDAEQQIQDAVDQAKAQADARAEYKSTVRDMDMELGNVSPLVNQLQQIQQWATDAANNLNKLAIAAGRSGAAEADLAKVHEIAAQRAAAAIAALKDASLSLAQKLGYVDTLDSLNSQIAALQAGAGAASEAVGGAAQSFSDAADSLKLQIGDLSPYSDQKKLELAMQGLAAGSVSAEEVLTIGRRLYASGDDYNRLFEQVMGMNHSSSGGGGSYSGSSSTGGSNNSKELADLIARRDALEAAQRKSDAKELAQNIADLAQAQHISVEDVAKQLGINLDDLAKDLGVGNDAVAKYIESLEKQDLAGTFVDQAGNIVDAVQSGADRVVQAIWNMTIGGRGLPTNGDGGLIDLAFRPVQGGGLITPVLPPSTGTGGTGGGTVVRPPIGTVPGASEGAVVSLLTNIAQSVGATASMTEQAHRLASDQSLKRDAFTRDGT